MNEGSGYNLPDKLYFRIGEVSDIVGVKPYVLRYWETEFTDIKPSKSKSGQRLYKKKDVEMLLMIKELLYKERFTINGAKQRLKETGRHPHSAEQAAEVPVHLVESKTADAEVQQQLIFDEAEEETERADVIKLVPDSSPSEAKPAMAPVDKKFLEKIRADLQWCLNELRAG